MRLRRLRREPAGLDVTAFINLIVVLVPFLLSTAVFTRLSVLDLALPAQSTGALEKLSAEKLNLEVVIRGEAIEVGDRIGGLIQSIPKTSTGRYDIVALSTLARAIKEKFPDTTAVTVLPEPNVPYDVLVQAMDALRTGHQVQGTKVVEVVLFPDISIGDAPIRQAAR
ncbi:MAG TPA: biopolymer transporter ExbD [Burkholderiaceae bacterium]|nr:biopolymer transporter ExbD [Burkholderiaceae bacterium]HQR69873.1 biopolymer transporter ExbD [Burkholderiaceae bacterium]